MTRRVRPIPEEAGPYVHADPVNVRGERHGERWVVTVGDDPTPIAERPTREEAEIEAREHALAFGHKHVVVHELDGEETVIELPDPDPQPPYPGGARGAPAAG
jgi:hypothetical protein